MRYTLLNFGLVQVYPEGKTVVFEQFTYDAVEQRIRMIASGKEGTHNVFVDKLLFFKEVQKIAEINV